MLDVGPDSVALGKAPTCSNDCSTYVSSVANLAQNCRFEIAHGASRSRLLEGLLRASAMWPRLTTKPALAVKTRLQLGPSHRLEAVGPIQLRRRTSAVKVLRHAGLGGQRLPSPTALREQPSRLFESTKGASKLVFPISVSLRAYRKRKRKCWISA